MPCVGKSWCLKNNTLSKTDSLFFGEVKSVTKLFYILKGIISTSDLFLLSLKIYWVNKSESNLKDCIVKLLIVWSRIGALKSRNNICLDEGCCQALWGWFNTYPINKKNIDLWIKFLKIFRKHTVKFKWIKGHNNHPQNERCDHLAYEASKKENLLIDKEYENQDEIKLL